jgi:hypothetical protein
MKLQMSQKVFTELARKLSVLVLTKQIDEVQAVTLVCKDEEVTLEVKNDI